MGNCAMLNTSKSTKDMHYAQGLRAFMKVDCHVVYFGCFTFRFSRICPVWFVAGLSIAAPLYKMAKKGPGPKRRSTGEQHASDPDNDSDNDAASSEVPQKSAKQRRDEEFAKMAEDIRKATGYDEGHGHSHGGHSHKKKKKKKDAKKEGSGYNWSAIAIMALMAVPAAVSMAFSVRTPCIGCSKWCFDGCLNGCLLATC